MSAALVADRVDAGEPEQTKRPPPRSVERLRLGLVMLGLALLVFAQNAGNVAADTKLDLIVSPLRFLGRSLRLWDPIGGAGQLQNQAYGYLFPMGPFFAIGHAANLAPWQTQRLWETAIVTASFLGTYLVSRRLGVAGFWPPVAAGLVYALAPRSLSELTSISSELMPVAALPWVLLPLVTASLNGSPRRAAARSGIAFLFAGGVNAAATLAVLPVPILWLSTRKSGPRRRALAAWWAFAILLGSAWWALPLALLGRYSPPFLDWIETAQTTTATTSFSASMRGVEHWESYLGAGVWPGAWILVTAPAAILATTVVAAAGLAGLAHRHVPQRLFLCACLGTGLVLLSLGHAAPIGTPFAGVLRGWLDRDLVAFRNIHKFDPLVRLPLAVGVGLLFARIRLPSWRSITVSGLRLRLPVRTLGGLLAAAVALVAITPALGNRLVSDPRADADPAWWRQAGQWLADHPDGSRAIVVPGAARPTYFWGSTVDDALQPVAKTPWIGRAAAPLAQAGTVRLLDAFEQRLAAGQRDMSLAQLMARSGIGWVVLRNDLDSAASLATPNDVVAATLDNSPGFDAVAGFGPTIGGPSASGQLDGGDAGRPAVEIFRVTPSLGLVGLLSTDGAVVANGSSDALPQLVERGLPASTAVLFGDSQRAVAQDSTIRVATDGIRRQQAGFGNALDKSRTLASNEFYTGTRKTYDYLPSPSPTLSTMRYVGATGISASSSGSDVYAAFNRSPANGPWAAVDDDQASAWRSGSATGAVGQWIELRLDKPVTVASIRAAFVAGFHGYPSRIEVRTAAGRRVDDVASTSAIQVLPMPNGATTTVRLTVLAMAGGGFGDSVGVSTLSIPGIEVGRTLSVPGVGAPDVMAFDAAAGYRDGCLDVDGSPRCDAALAASGEEDGVLDRTVRLTQPKSYLPSATVRLPATQALDDSLDALLPIRAAASSVDSTDPRERPGSAVDGDPATAWVAAPGDATPSLTLDLGARSLVRGVRLVTAPNSFVAMPLRVRVDAGSETWEGDMPGDGVINLPHSVQARTVKITVLVAQARRSVNTATGELRLLPVGINTVTVESDRSPVPLRLAPVVDFDCQAGLQLTVDGTAIPLRVHAGTADILAGAPVSAEPCSPLPLNLAAGAHRFSLSATSWALPRSLTLATENASIGSASRPPGTFVVRSWGATTRRIQVDATARSLLVVRENFNAGWRASVGGHRLEAVQVDGWQQAFVVPAGTTGTVLVTYGPQRTFAAALLIGLAAAVGLFLLAAARPSRSMLGPAPDATPGALVLIVLVAVLSVALAGVAGVLTLAVLMLVRRLLWPGERSVPTWCCAAVFIAAGIGIASAPPLRTFVVANSGVTQLLSVSAVLLSIVGSLPPVRKRHGRDP
jgi:arabinofuranan 3-O-arabinosyltransferase